MHSRWLETLQFWIGRQILFGTTSWRRTFEFESGISACFTPFHLGSRFFGKLFGWWCLVLFVLGCVLCLFCFGRLLSRCRSFLSDLMTVRAVMVRAALKKKTHHARHEDQWVGPRNWHRPLCAPFVPEDGLLQNDVASAAGAQPKAKANPDEISRTLSTSFHHHPPGAAIMQHRDFYS